jgi:hypothetical protein
MCNGELAGFLVLAERTMQELDGEALDFRFGKRFCSP